MNIVPIYQKKQQKVTPKTLEINETNLKNLRLSGYQIKFWKFNPHLYYLKKEEICQNKGDDNYKGNGNISLRLLLFSNINNDIFNLTKRDLILQ